IPSNFAHLQIVAYLRGSDSQLNSDVYLRFNNDSGANYDYVLQITRHNASLGTNEGVSASQIVLGPTPAGNSPGNTFGSQKIEIPYYANTSNHKTIQSTNGFKQGTTTANFYTGSAAGWWKSTAAINRVTLLPIGGNFLAGSRVTVYGLE
ncbi:MAG TPA: hypothetical protein VNA68_02435, partial [Candidatus Dormibacteraeota bacterium]|nr:hypothetical protein [Candidatus Dormibacteraeota bacterium]